MNLDQLLEFCAYYQINQNLASLPIRIPLVDNNQEQKNRNETGSKIKKKKIETIPQPKVQKVTKSKVQVPSKKQKNADQVSPNVPQHQKNLDLNFFINHMSGTNPPHQYNNSDNYRIYGHHPKNQDRNSNNLNKYSTFGRNDTFNGDLPVYQRKTGAYQDKRVYQSSINNNNNLFQSNLLRGNQNYGGMRNQIMNYPNYPYQHNFYQPEQNLFPQSKFKVNNNVFNTQSKITQRNINPFQIIHSYSPIHRQNQLSPSHSAFNINASTISDRSLSKSRKKHQRKNSQRPFYDASSSRLKESKQKQLQDKVINQSVFQNSQFISISDISKIHPYPVKKTSNNETKRQTTSSNSVQMKQYGQKRQTFDLDDQIQQPMNYITSQQRSVPVAINFKNANHDF